jgi:hypothetical protein
VTLQKPKKKKLAEPEELWARIRAVSVDRTLLLMVSRSGPSDPAPEAAHVEE